MKKRCMTAVLAAVTVLLLAGCASLYEADYYYSEEYAGGITVDEVGGTEVRNISMLKAALIALINSGQEHGQLKLSNYNGSPQDDLARVCYEVKNDNPIGAYAVSDITVNTNRIVSYYVAEIDISYKKDVDEIKSVINTVTVAEFSNRVLEAVRGYQDKIVLKIYSSTVDTAYIQKLIEDSYYDDPLVPVILPEVTVTAYPEEGANRIFEIGLDFAASPEKMDAMSEEAAAAVRAVCDATTATEPGPLALEVVKYLSGTCTAEEETDFGGTAYAALTAGSADSKAVALAFKAICNELGLECLVVKGSLGAMAEQHFWNIIKLGDDHYHVDVSRFAESPEGSFLVSDDRLWGRYIWEAGSYPACTGELDYYDFGDAPQVEEQEETVPPEEGDQPEGPPHEEPDPESSAAPQPEETPPAETQN